MFVSKDGQVMFVTLKCVKKIAQITVNASMAINVYAMLDTKAKTARYPTVRIIATTMESVLTGNAYVI